MTGTTVGPIAVFSSAPITYAPRCGQVAPAAVPLSIANNGTSALSISSVVASAGFTITKLPAGPIPPSGKDTIMVQANAPSGEAGGSVRAGTVSFSTNEFGNPSYKVGLSATIQGANLAFTDSKGSAISSQPLVCCGSTSPCEVWWYCPYTGLTYYVTNTGNEAATLGAAIVSEPAYFAVAPLSPSSTVAAGGMVSGAPWGPDYSASPPTCSPTGPLNHNETVTYPATGDICVPLPILTVVLEGDTPC
jgi:hypothetical protein